MSSRVALLDRLDALYDDDLATLHRLFEELQLATVEAAQADDFTTFVCSARYFAAIQDTSRLVSQAFPAENNRLDKNALSRDVSQVDSRPSPASRRRARKRKAGSRESCSRLIAASFADDADAVSISDTPIVKSEFNQDSDAGIAQKSKLLSEEEEMDEWILGEDVKSPVRKAVKMDSSGFNPTGFNSSMTNTAGNDSSAGDTSSLGSTRLHDDKDKNGFPSLHGEAAASWHTKQIEHESPQFLFGVQDTIWGEVGQERLTGLHDRPRFSGTNQKPHTFAKSDTQGALSNWNSMPSASTIVPTADVLNYSTTSGHRFPICGFVYLLSTRHSPYLSGVGEMSIGIIITENEREKGLAKDALDQVLQIAFDKIQCQRVQAQIIDGPLKGAVLRLFTKLRFGHEGTRRRSFYSPFMQEWKDTTCLAMLATDWVIRSSLQPAPPSLWDEMFLRHDRERDALLRWDQGIIDEQRRLLHRTTSMETIRDLHHDSQEENSDAKSVLSTAKGKEKELSATGQSDAFVDEASDPEYQLMESDDEGWNSDASPGASSPPLSVSSIESSGSSFALADVSDILHHLTPRSDGYVSSSEGSQWDMLETSSSSSFDNVSESEYYRGR